MRVKICGMTNLADAEMTVFYGADALGFLIGLDYPSDDEVDAATAAKIIDNLPPFVSSVLVTHRTDAAWIEETCREIGCSTIQLHGDFPLEEIPALRRVVPSMRVVKAIHVIDASAVGLALAAARWADAVVLDSRTATRIGGTGTTHDWSISARIVKEVGKPVVLAGGLNPENVRQAIATVWPFAVDVNSGVESLDGSKSPEKIKSFISLAKGLRNDAIQGGRNF